MLRRLVLPLALAVAVAAPTAASEPPIVPIPASVKTRAGTFAVTQATALVVEPGDVGAHRAAANFADLVAHTHGLRLSVRNDRPAGAIVFQRSRGGPSEGYRIHVDARGARLTASTEAGFSHATATLWQLLAKGRNSATLPAIDIEDAPRFPWRGILLDSARHFQSPEFVRRFIDWMALHKLNVLHWHLTDDQAWRLEILKYPRLAQVGGWRVPEEADPSDLDPATGRPRMYGGYYSQGTVRALVAYAAERGITIVPEISMPGRAAAAIFAYPQLAALPRPPAGVPSHPGPYPDALNVEERTFAFLEDVLREVMALFPSPYIHLGAGRVEAAQWTEAPAMRARLGELGLGDAAKAHAYFTQRIARFVHANGRRAVGWDEILAPGLPAGAVVMAAHDVDTAIAAAAAGFDAVVAAQPALFLDNAQSSAAREPPGRGRIVWLRDVYEFEPLSNSVPAELRRHVLGVQANVWTGLMRTESAVAWMTYPRAAAVAEVGWSQPGRRSWEGFHRRMQALEARYPSVELGARPLAEPAPRRRRGAGAADGTRHAQCASHSFCRPTSIDAEQRPAELVAREPALLRRFRAGNPALPLAGPIPLSRR